MKISFYNKTASNNYICLTILRFGFYVVKNPNSVITKFCLLNVHKYKL